MDGSLFFSTDVWICSILFAWISSFLYIFHQNVVVVTSRFFENMKAASLREKGIEFVAQVKSLNFQLSSVPGIPLSFVLRLENRILYQQK